MGLLKKLSRKSDKEVKNKAVSTRVTEKEFEAFSDLCDSTGFTMSEALRLLILQEINELDLQVKTKDIQTFTESKPSSSQSKQLSSNDKQKLLTVNNRKQISNSNRFTTKKWVVNDRLPCPICNAWLSASNFSRHAKEHNMTSQAIFTEHGDKADQMVEIEKSTI